MENSRKIYYTMGEVSEMLDVTPSLLRYWEKYFSILRPHKNKKGNRLFTPADVDNLKLIYHLVKEKRMTLAGAEKALKTGRGEMTRDTELMDRLLRVRSLLEEIRQELGEDEGDPRSIVVEAAPADTTPAPQPVKVAPQESAPHAQGKAAPKEAEPAEAAAPGSEPAPPPAAKPAEPAPEPVIPHFVQQTLF